MPEFPYPPGQLPKLLFRKLRQHLQLFQEDGNRLLLPYFQILHIIAHDDSRDHCRHENSVCSHEYGDDPAAPCDGADITETYGSRGNEAVPQPVAQSIDSRL